MSMKLDKRLFTLLLAGMIIIIAAAGILIGLKLGGFLDSPSTGPGTDDWYTNTSGDEEEGPWGDKTFTWTYDGKDRTLSCYISKEIYLEYQYGIRDAELPKDLISYAVHQGDGGVIQTVAAELESIAGKAGMTEQQKLDLVFSFVQSIRYQTDTESGRSAAYPRTPVGMLAEETGDSVDHAVLASALLTQLGYGTAVIYYPATYDRLTIIPEAAALGMVVSAPQNDRPTYSALTTAPAKPLTFVPRQTGFYPVSGTAAFGKPAGAGSADGWYAGDGTWKSKNYSGTLGKATYTPATGMFSADAVPRLPDNFSDAVTYQIENTGWYLPVSPYWMVDTASKGTPQAAYDGIVPVISADDALWQGKPKASLLPYEEQMAETLLLHSATGVSFSPKQWQTNTSAYYTNTWYPSGIGWTAEDKWRLYQKFLEIKDVPSTLYTPWGTAEHTAPVPWRVSYLIQKMDEDHSEEEMTPYSDLRIAVYAVEDSGALTLITTGGWQGQYSAEKYQTIGPFSPGRYAIGVFVRNAKAEISIEYSGKDSTTSYTGGI